MYRFLIIDDEPVVREGIAENIDWHAHGFELVAACRDGREGLQAVEEHRPDVVLTDICMPFVDGLELASTIADQYPRTKTILLTGYDEFEYAQEAVKLKVADFLLKPITAGELRTLLDTIREQLDADSYRRRQMERLNQQLTESLPVLQERFLNRLISSAVPQAEVHQRLSFLDVSLPGPSYAVLVSDPDAVTGDDGHAGLAAQQLVRELAASWPDAVTFGTERDCAVMIISAETVEEARQRALRYAQAISDGAKRELGVTVSVGTGEPATALEAIPQSYADARMALDHRLILGPDHIITAQQVRGVADHSSAQPDREARERFVGALKLGSAGEAASALADLIAHYRTDGGSNTGCFVAMQRLLADALNALERLGIEHCQLPQLGPNPFEQLGKLKTLEDIERWFQALHRHVSALLEERRQRHSHTKAMDAERFIRANYGDPELSLSTVCDALAISKSYFSPLFKEHTGKTFVEYLTELRMERAKELLAGEDLRGYQIADRVGYRDAHYFSLTFRKQTGVSPTEYREQVRGAAGGRA